MTGPCLVPCTVCKGMHSHRCDQPPQVRHHGGTDRPASADASMHRVDPATGCWEWLGPKTPQGYAERHAHRRYYAEAKGPIPEGFHVHHECKNPGCVNPDHLQALSPAEHFAHHKLGEVAGLTLDDVRDIRELGRTGVSSAVVAERYGISRKTVHYYWRGERYAELLGETDRVEAAGRICQHCDVEMPASMNRHARFCSQRCQTLAWNKANRKRKKAA